MTLHSQIRRAASTAIAPSNIAFQKYWGKRDVTLQWPANDSISMTLTRAQTMTTARIQDQPFDVFEMAGTRIDSQAYPDHKVMRHIAMLRAELGLAGSLYIESRNTFPSDCGIASSASGFAALTLAVVSALAGQPSWEGLDLLGITRDRLAHWARRGSGSAGRSLYGGIVQWEAGVDASKQKIEAIFPATHWKISDVIVILSDAKKPTPTSSAHLAAWASPLFAPRLAGLEERSRRIKNAVAGRDISALGIELEQEALEMHAVAMTGEPPIRYLLPSTCEFLSWVRNERSRGALAAWFTIDAGANVHLICETDNETQIEQHVTKHWPHLKLLVDQIGDGPTLMKGEL